MVAHIDPIDGPGAWYRAEAAEAEFACDDIEHVSAHANDTGAAGSIGEVVDQFDRFLALIIDLEELRRRESCCQDFSVAPNGEASQPCSGWKLVKDLDGEREGRTVRVEGAGVEWRRQGGDEQRSKEKNHREKCGEIHDGNAFSFSE